MSDTYQEHKSAFDPSTNGFGTASDEDVDLINVSGHIQELDRSFGVWSICTISVVTDNAWAVGGGALVLALSNGGGPGVIYGLIAATFFYVFIAASLAELSSSIPSSAGVYHWASVAAGPRFGRITSFFAGCWNCLAWIFGVATNCAFSGNAIVALYALYNPGYVPERWQIFIAYIGVLCLTSAATLFGQRFLARASLIAGVVCSLCLVVTVLACAILPSKNGSGYASDAFVWTEWQNNTGWSSDGFVFLLGMVNGAYAIGTPDAVCHLSEEIPDPKRNIPKGIFAQMSVGFITTFAFYIAILYGVTSLEDVNATPITSLPLAAMFQQATGSTTWTAALLVLFLIDIIIAMPGPYIAAGRMMWTLARDDALPFSHTLRRVSPTWRNPFAAQLACSLIVAALGCIYIGSATAFNAFVGAFTILTTLSYLAAILPHALSARKNVPPGPFYMSAPWAYVIMGIACAYIVVFDVIYMFPFVMPTNKDTMNYSCVMVGGWTVLAAVWYAWKRNRGYEGPSVALGARNDVRRGVVGLSMEEEAEKRRAAARLS